MSEDSTNQPLRLKPRDRSTPTEAPAAPVDPARVAPTSSSEAPRLTLRPKSAASAADPLPLAAPASAPANGSEIGKIKLKPKSPSPSPSASGQTSPIQTAPIASAAPLVEKAVLSPASAPASPPPAVAPAVVSPAEVPSTDVGRFKLKPKTEVPAATVAEPVAPPPAATPPPAPVPSAEPPVGAFIKSPSPVQTPPEAVAPVDLSAARLKPKPPAPPEASPASLPPVAVLPPAAVASAPSARPAVPHLRAAAAAPRNAEGDDARAFKAGVWVTAGLLILVVVGGGTLAFSYFKQKQSAMHRSATGVPPAPSVAAQSSSSKPAPSAPSEALLPGQPVVEHPRSLPGQLVGKARDVLAEREKGSEVAGVNDVLGGEGGSPVPKPVARPTVRPPSESAAARSETADAPDIAASAPVPSPAPVNTPPPPPPPPGPQLRAFVVNLRINGVFQGEPARALLNGRMVRVGETIDSSLHIVLHQVDPERKLLIFQDASGAIMPRRY